MQRCAPFEQGRHDAVPPEQVERRNQVDASRGGRDGLDLRAGRAPAVHGPGRSAFRGDDQRGRERGVEERPCGRDAAAGVEEHA